MKQSKNQWTERDVNAVLMNPIYAITLHPDLFGEHSEHLISRDQWVAANARLIAQMGAEAYLRRLLTVLEGDFPRQPSEPSTEQFDD